MEVVRGVQERRSGEEVRIKARTGGKFPERRSLEEVRSGGNKRWSGVKVVRGCQERMSGERRGEDFRRKARRNAREEVRIKARSGGK